MKRELLTSYAGCLALLLARDPEEVDQIEELHDLADGERVLGTDATDEEMNAWLIAHRGYQQGPVLCQVGWTTGRTKKLHRAEACHRTLRSGKVVARGAQLACGSRRTLAETAQWSGYTSILHSFEAFDAARITCSKCQRGA